MPHLSFSVPPDNVSESDRVYYISENPVALSTFTVGSMSYICSSILNIYTTNRPTDILLGRHSSLASDIRMILSANHHYKNTISTGLMYPSTAPKQPADNNKKNPAYRNVNNNHYQIIIGHDVWIGIGATIMGGVKIGSGAIIGTNAMVTKNVPPYAVVVGNPGRIIRYRFDADTIRKLLAIKWWNWDKEKISASVHMFGNPEKFLAEHYTPELKYIPYEKIEGGVCIGGISRGRQANLFVCGGLSRGSTALEKSCQRLPQIAGKKSRTAFLERRNAAGRLGESTKFRWLNRNF